MKVFFSIGINHEYDNRNDNHVSVSNDLAIVPASFNTIFVKNNRLWFRSQAGSLDCFIEDEKVFKSDVEMLFFWVICTNEAFYSYTDYPIKINFSNPYYYWVNPKEGTVLQQSEVCDLHPGKPPKRAIGCIGLSLKNIDASKEIKFTVDFKVKETYWEYHIMTIANQEGIKYAIVDLDFIPNTEKNDKIEKEVKNDNQTFTAGNNKEWKFKQISTDKTSEIIFRSTEPITYEKMAFNRLKLVWGAHPKKKFQKDQEMILPFANYAYKMVDKDNKELTPIYIHI